MEMPAARMRSYTPEMASLSISREKPQSVPRDMLMTSTPMTTQSSRAARIQEDLAEDSTSEKVFMMQSWALGATPVMVSSRPAMMPAT